MSSIYWHVGQITACPTLIRDWNTIFFIPGRRVYGLIYQATFLELLASFLTIIYIHSFSSFLFFYFYFIYFKFSSFLFESLLTCFAPFFCLSSFGSNLSSLSSYLLILSLPLCRPWPSSLLALLLTPLLSFTLSLPYFHLYHSPLVSSLIFSYFPFILLFITTSLHIYTYLPSHFPPFSFPHLFLSHCLSAIVWMIAVRRSHHRVSLITWLQGNYPVKLSLPESMKDD